MGTLVASRELMVALVYIQAVLATIHLEGHEIFNEYLNMCWTFQTCINGAPNSLTHQDHVVQYYGSTCG